MTGTQTGTDIVENTPSGRYADRVSDNRFVQESTDMARAAFAHYDPKCHRLSRRPKDDRVANPEPHEISYHDFFRRYATADYNRPARNPKLAADILDLMIADAGK